MSKMLKIVDNSPCQALMDALAAKSIKLLVASAEQKLFCQLKKKWRTLNFVS